MRRPATPCSLVQCGAVVGRDAKATLVSAKSGERAEKEQLEQEKAQLEEQLEAVRAAAKLSEGHQVFFEMVMSLLMMPFAR